MALTRSTLLSDNSAGDFGTDPYTTTGTFTPPDNSLIVAAVVVQERNGTTDPSGDLTISGGGWTWTPRVNIGSTNSWTVGVRVWTAPVTTGASMSLTFDCATRYAHRYVVSVIAYTGYDTDTPTGATATDGAGPNDGAASITLSAAPSSTSEVLGVLGSDTGSSSAPASGWVEIHDNQGLGDAGIQTQIRGSSTSTTVAWDDVYVTAGTAAGPTVLAAVEIKEATGGGGPTLAPRAVIVAG